MAHGRKRIILAVAIGVAALGLAAGLWMSRTRSVTVRWGALRSYSAQLLAGMLHASRYVDDPSRLDDPAVRWERRGAVWAWTASQPYLNDPAMVRVLGGERTAAGGLVAWSKQPASVTVWWLRVSLWPVPPLLAVVSGGVAWSGLRAKRRWGRREAVCVKCGYDRAGLPAGAACAECGTKAAVAG